ncbi:MAG: undecaprenyl/decaprenyl-phosphate alpha-N-acetylglucosaminyl 1-phosphate transferase [Treponemataceae bacterium]|nr:undecaprenyl/decaprenyl-phosphate alpha-N-acetylglucosaminyl 1-phosphate transferase [Treponemataceae bacterium]
MGFILILMVATWGLSLCFVWCILRFSQKKGWFDHHDERKIHQGQIPRLGGVGFITAYVGMVVILLLSGFWKEGSQGISFFFVLAAMLLILIFGMWDDFKPLRARYKFIIQGLAALLVVLAGYRFQRLSFPEIGLIFQFGWLSYPLTFIWIIGIINAINLIDGIDGLAGGISVIILSWYTLIYYAMKNTQAWQLSLLLIGALMGFLCFNFPLPRAQIFMGDTGSQFLGFFIALLPIWDTVRWGISPISLPYAAGLTLIPILDTFAAIWRRVRDKRGIYEPDREHTHHKLLALGYTPLQVDGILYALQFVSGLFITLSLTIAKAFRVSLVLTAYGIVAAFFVLLHYAYTHRIKCK